jgi:5'-methylthioadenosine phosphorylase
MKVGMIGGSGFDDPSFLKDVKSAKIGTPFGPPSHDIVTGKANGIDVVLMLRHGRGHRLPPARVNFRANIWAMKEAGVTHIIATTACGSLKEEIEPGHIVFPDQFIDRTTSRKSSFYEGDQVAHISMADPFCENLRAILIQTAKKLGITHHPTATVVTIEGPRFSTRAESRMFKAWGGDIINMSTVPEAVLAREAGICYAQCAMSTDYDAWHHSEEPVTWEMIIQVMTKNVENVKKIFFESLPMIKDEDCACRTAINNALV